MGNLFLTTDGHAAEAVRVNALRELYVSTYNVNEKLIDSIWNKIGGENPLYQAALSAHKAFYATLLATREVWTRAWQDLAQYINPDAGQIYKPIPVTDATRGVHQLDWDLALFVDSGALLRALGDMEVARAEVDARMNPALEAAAAVQQQQAIDQGKPPPPAIVTTPVRPPMDWETTAADAIIDALPTKQAIAEAIGIPEKLLNIKALAGGGLVAVVVIGAVVLFFLTRRGG